MNLPNTVAKVRFVYHVNMLDICNVLNQVKILNDEKAEKKMKGHTMACFDCMERLGLNPYKYVEK